MPAYLTVLDPAPMPADDAWVQQALAAGQADGASGVVVTRPLGSGPAVAAVLHDELPRRRDADGAETVSRAVFYPGTAGGPARFATVVQFDGPRSPEWSAAESRASHDRIHPAVKDVPGYVGTLRLVRDDGGVLTVSLGETAEALQESMERILATELLPGEDPALLTGPDRTTFSVVVRADLPVAVGGLTPGASAPPRGRGATPRRRSPRRPGPAARSPPR